MKAARLLISLVTPLLLGSCSDSLFDMYEQRSGESQQAEDTGWQPSDCSIDEVGFSSFAIMTTVNEKVLADLKFDISDAKDTCTVEHYLLENKRLVPSWDGVAAKVTVDGVEQRPDSTVVNFAEPVTYRLYASDGQFKEYEFVLEQGTYTGLPVASMYTATSVTSKERWVTTLFKLSAQQSGYDDLAYFSEVKLRGNNSFGQKKKSYTLKLGQRGSVLGMKNHKRWCFIANAPDRTSLRNRVAYEISSRTGLSWTPSTRYCELIVNNKYCGLYLIVEQIRVDKNRVNVTEMHPSDTTGTSVTGGYLLEFDRYLDDNSFYTAVRDLPVNIKYPKEDSITDAQALYIKDYIKKIEQLLYQKETPDPSYRQYLDLESFADVWIVLELTCCRDAKLPGSVWYHKDRGGPLAAGPVWDFDIATFIASSSWLLYDYETTDFVLSDRSIWYSRLFKDDEFRRIVKQRWLAYLPTLQTIPDFIDRQADYIRESAAVNYEVWPAYITGNSDYQLPWEEAVEQLKENYLFRLNFLDNEITSW